MMPGNGRRSSMAARKLAMLLEDGTDRGGGFLGNDKHRGQLVTHAATGKPIPGFAIASRPANPLREIWRA